MTGYQGHAKIETTWRWQNDNSQQVGWALESEPDVYASGSLDSEDCRTTSDFHKSRNGKAELEMNDASSMVSEISPIIAFLKYIVGREPGGGRRRYLEANAKSGFFIFIEEPEAHLHPKNQVALIRALAGLAKQNVILVMASHSNYIFNQLNNMVLKRTLDQNSYSPILLKREGEKSRSVYTV